MHAFLASNTVTNDYYPELASRLFKVAVELKEKTGVTVEFINLSGGVGIPYKPDQKGNDIAVIGAGVRRVFKKILVPAGMENVAIYTEMGRFILGPYGALIAQAIHANIFTKNTLAWMPVQLTSCVLPFMVLTIILPCWARRMILVRISTI